ncbi:hypothetical protein LJK87_09030 [Paenibacillus sp. P25]|nr:hypothetical protein LJK87_09030 [Paenibacillus sp. P25]
MEAAKQEKRPGEQERKVVRDTQTASTPSAETADRREPNRPRKLSYKDQKDWDEIEDKIAGLESKLEETRKQIERAGSDFGKVSDLYRQEQELSAELEQAMDRWAELSELVEQIAQNK